MFIRIYSRFRIATASARRLYNRTVFPASLDILPNTLGLAQRRHFLDLLAMRPIGGPTITIRSASS
jgi:hypothetical protein